MSSVFCETALHHAVMFGGSTAASPAEARKSPRLLIDKGADVNAACDGGSTR